jgi:hypothetical protein
MLFVINAAEVIEWRFPNGRPAALAQKSTTNREF